MGYRRKDYYHPKADRSSQAAVDRELELLFGSEDRSHNGLSPCTRSLLLILVLDLHDALPALIGRDSLSADEVSLALTHAIVDVDVLDLDVERAMFLHLEPRPGFPANVQNEEERTCEIVLEEDRRISIGATDWPDGNIKLGDEADEVHDHADVRSVDSQGCLEREFINAVAIKFPIDAELVVLNDL